MNGKVFSVSLIVFSLIFGAILYYFQVFAFYKRVDDLSFILVNGIKIPVANYKGIDSDSSALKLRGCFTTEPNLFMTLPVASNPTPLSGPFWLDCFDHEHLFEKIQIGSGKSYMAAKNEYDGIDRVVMVFNNGEAYQWRQLNSKYLDK